MMNAGEPDVWQYPQQKASPWTLGQNSMSYNLALRKNEGLNQLMICTEKWSQVFDKEDKIC